MSSKPTSSSQPVRVYIEPKGTVEVMQRRYWRQSSEAQAAGQPYLVIRPVAKYAKVVCDWITAHKDGRSPAVIQFVTAVKEILCREYPAVRAKYLGAYTFSPRA